MCCAKCMFRLKFPFFIWLKTTHSLLGFGVKIKRYMLRYLRIEFSSSDVNKPVKWFITTDITSASLFCTKYVMNLISKRMRSNGNLENIIYQQGRLIKDGDKKTALRCIYRYCKIFVTYCFCLGLCLHLTSACLSGVCLSKALSFAFDTHTNVLYLDCVFVWPRLQVTSRSLTMWHCHCFRTSCFSTSYSFLVRNIT